tara:strand:+ start:329 stop:685 length:357 start_codon:yes stop_codon:yes gene_type:complete
MIPGVNPELPQARADDEAQPELPLERPEEMPVVARMVVEVRSDGTKTVARGAIEDLQTGQQVAIQTDALSTNELSTALAQSLLATSGLAKEALKALLPSPLDPLRRVKRRLLGRRRAE